MVRQIERRLRDKPLQPYLYRDFGSLVAIGKWRTVGNLTGAPTGRTLFVEGVFAGLIYRALRFMHERGLTPEDLAAVVVAQRRWAEHNPRALRRTLLTIDEVLAGPVVAYPFTRPMCCVVTDAGGAVVVANGEEEGKGTDLTRAAAAALRRPESGVTFKGYVEGKDVFSGEYDVIATDGFTGNVLLKTAEGAVWACSSVTTSPPPAPGSARSTPARPARSPTRPRSPPSVT